MLAAICSDGVWLAGGFLVYWLRGRSQPGSGQPSVDGESGPAFRWTWVGWIGAAVAAAFLVGSISSISTAMPHGDWDAWAIWNMRAKFLAADGAWRGAVSQELFGRSHPEYPLLWPGLVGKAWSATGSVGQTAAPILAGALSCFGLLALLLAGLWAMRSAATGLMAVCALLTCFSFWQYAAAQYADIPLAMFMLAALLTATLAEEEGWEPALLALSGILSSMAAWTKLEGVVFCAALFLVLAARAHRRALIWLTAALPVLMVVLAFRFLAAPSFEAWSFANMREPGRIGAILAAFGAELRDLGQLPYHPFVIVLICSALLGFRRPARPLWPLLPVAILGAADITAFSMTISDLNWHLETAAGRLVLQLCPMVLFCVFLLFKTPASAEPSATQQKAKR